MTALDIVDIHTHLWPPAWAPGGRHARPAQALPSNFVARITLPETQAAEFRQGGVSICVVIAMIESLFGTDGPVDFNALREANDWLAALAAGSPAVTAFGATDAFAGEQGAREAERAFVELGLSGLAIDSPRAGLRPSGFSSRCADAHRRRRRAGQFSWPGADEACRSCPSSSRRCSMTYRTCI